MAESEPTRLYEETKMTYIFCTILKLPGLAFNFEAFQHFIPILRNIIDILKQDMCFISF
jgi:hypothetical protein